MLGCTLMGANLIAMMASFPAVRERTQHWSEEVERSNYFIDRLLAIEGSRVLSEYPRKHSLTKVDTTGSFDTVAKTHKRKGFFLSDELSQRGIVGEFAGATRAWKLNDLRPLVEAGPLPRRRLHRDRRKIRPGRAAMTETVWLVRYAEVFLKSDPVRRNWERVLAHAITRRMPGVAVRIERGRLWADGPGRPGGAPAGLRRRLVLGGGLLPARRPGRGRARVRGRARDRGGRDLRDPREALGQARLPLAPEGGRPRRRHPRGPPRPPGRPRVPRLRAPSSRSATTAATSTTRSSPGRAASPRGSRGPSSPSSRAGSTRPSPRT